MPNKKAATLVPRVALAIGSLVVLALLVMPYSGLEAIRGNVGWVDRTSAWLNTITPGLDIEHLVVFAALGALARFAQRRPRLLLTLVLLGLFGLATELAQLWISSRSARVDDLLLNFAGAGLGYALASGLAWSAGMVRGGAAHPTGSQR